MTVLNLNPLPRDTREETTVYRDVTDLNLIQMFLGSYDQMLRKAMECYDGATHETLEAVRVGVTSLDSYFMMPHVIVSVESFQATNREATQVSMEAVSDNIKAVAKAVKNAIVKLFEYLRKLWHSTGADLALIKSRLTALKKRIAGINSKPKAYHITVQGINRIAIDGKVALTGRKSIDEIRKTAEFLHVDYPALLKGMIQKLGDVQRKHAGRYDNLQKEMDGVTPKALLKSKIYAHESSDAVEVERQFIEAVKARAGNMLLPGNKQLVVNTEGLGSDDSIANRIRFDVVKARQVDDNSTDLVVLTPPEMSTLVARLDGIVDYMISNSVYQKQYDLIQDRLVDEADRIADAGGDDTLRRGTEQRLQRISVLVTQPLNGFNHYIVDTLSAYLGIVRFHASQYGEAA